MTVEVHLIDTELLFALSRRDGFAIVALGIPLILLWRKVGKLQTIVATAMAQMLAQNSTNRKIDNLSKKIDK